MEKILLVDGSHLARRNFHSQHLSTSSGLQTGLIYGVINSLITIQGKVKARHVIVVGDAKGSSDFRKEIYPLYKGNRSAADANFYEQKILLYELLNALGICNIETSQAEADDIIGYLANVKYVNNPVYILSGDEDFLSLISPRVKVISPTKGLIFQEKDGKITKACPSKKVIRLRPSQMIDFKCLVGDSSDNIPGAPGFGPGAAITFFEHNEGIDCILNDTVNTTGLTKRALAGLETVKPMLETFRKLVTINAEQGNVELTFPDIEPDKANALFSLFEFNQFKIRGEAMYSLRGVK